MHCQSWAQSVWQTAEQLALVSKGRTLGNNRHVERMWGPCARGTCVLTFMLLLSVRSPWCSHTSASHCACALMRLSISGSRALQPFCTATIFPFHAHCMLSGVTATWACITQSGTAVLLSESRCKRRKYLSQAEIRYVSSKQLITCDTQQMRGTT